MFEIIHITSAALSLFSVAYFTIFSKMGAAGSIFSGWLVSSGALHIAMMLSYGVYGMGALYGLGYIFASMAILIESIVFYVVISIIFKKNI